MASRDGVLATLDSSKMQWYHYKAVIISGMGFFTDAYDLFCVLPPATAAAINGVALCGTLLGQLFFGLLGDRMGRKKVYGITLFLMALSFFHRIRPILRQLPQIWFRIGGDYPLSATIMAEYANKKTRGSFIAAVFAMQGYGILGGGLVGMAVSAVFRSLHHAPPYSVNPVGSTPPEADYVWRIILMLGALLVVLSYYWRTKLPETASKSKFVLFLKEFLRRHGLHLIGTASTWFFVDVAYYSQNLFQKEIFSAVGWLPPAETMSALDELFKISFAQFLMALCGTVPGYWATVLVIDRIGRFTIQIMAFFFITVFMLALAIPYHHWTLNKTEFLIMYGLTFFFANFGPNSTTFIVPAEIFPARLRSTCHGISAAAGKAGETVGALGFLYAAQNQDKSKTDAGYPAGIGIKNSLFILSGINVLGLWCTFFVPEAKGRSLEEMSRDDEEEEQDHQSPSGVESV
ncbi:hypothetical protein MIMGU_mgv1a020654mg [Erythranthe guttata]|uniref:Major facilitator superfamily (MFS) profile domain-containing protein n=1 Tax=Erythranthe guttata TaxID=4155 RepID=A0A022PX62_ERYGU|nr:hypothetical protein MIMGU_mgv1a020654mg [Erythranthe guttata]